MVVFAPSIQSSNNINGLYVFGDSLSDVGNIYKATKGAYPPSPPYFQGRYSNGLIWVEYLASKLALKAEQITNFACGGAITGSDGINGVTGLLGQVDNFTKAHTEVNPNGLYVLWGGANDYLYGAEATTRPIQNLSMAIQSLSKAGAKKIMVANLPDLGKIPATRNSANSNSLNLLTTTHNVGLAKSLDELKQTIDFETQIIKVDVNDLYKQAIANPEKFGFTNVISACLNDLHRCENPDNFLFWDGIHPTTATHKILANAALTALNNGALLKSQSPKVVDYGASAEFN